MRPVRIVCATQHDEATFAAMELGVSLPRLQGRWGDLLRVSIVYRNHDGLSKIYNRFLGARYADEILLFTQHDVFLEDYWLVQRLNEALAIYDVVGVLGQSYPFPATEWEGKVVHWDRGTLAQGTPGANCFASQCTQWACSSPDKVFAISGEFMAVDTGKILAAGVRFDEAFSQDFYDLDFSRSCTQKGLKLGVWPIVETHNGTGLEAAKYGTKEKALAEWNRQKPAYVAKWKHKTCAIVSVIWGLGWDDLRVFANSLARSGYSGQKIMFVSDFVKYPGPNSKAVFEDARMPEDSLRELTDNLVRLGFIVVPWTPDITKRPATDRHRPVLEYFKSHLIPDWLIFTDTRDVVIQSDPQVWLEAHDYDLVGAGEGIAIKDQGDNLKWVVEAVGQKEADSVRGLEVCCHGTLIGKGPILLQYIEKLYSLLLAHPNQRLIDQGLGNWLLRQPPFNKQLVVTHRDGLVGSYVWDISSDSAKNQRIGISVRDGVIYQASVAVPVCHFWFTLPEAPAIRAKHWRPKILVAFLGWVGGEKNGDHQALRDTWLKDSGLDYKFFIGDGTPASPDEEEVIERTYRRWTKNGAQVWADIKKRKQVDPQGYTPRPDDVMVPCPDSYQYLGVKRRESCRYMLAHGYEYMFFASVDSYVRPERLLASGFEKCDYLGMCIPTPSTIKDETVTLDSYCFGGCGWMSAKAAGIVAEAPITYWCEDTWVGMALEEAVKDGRIVRKYDARYSEAPNLVTQKNDVIACHLSLKGEYDSREMRRCHDLFMTGRDTHHPRILIAFLGWVGGAKRGDHQALRDTWLKDLPKNLDYRFFVGDGTPLPDDEESQISQSFDEWEKSKGEVGSGHRKRMTALGAIYPAAGYEPEDDEILVPFPDGYEYLCYKRRESLRWATERGYEYVFCASVDVYARPERLVASDFQQYDYQGLFCGETGIPKTSSYIPDSYVFGGGYWLSAKAARIVANAPITHWCEDWWVGLVLDPAVHAGTIRRHMAHHDVSKYTCTPHFPAAGNDVISCHLSTGTYDNQDMYRCHEQFSQPAKPKRNWLHETRVISGSSENCPKCRATCIAHPIRGTSVCSGCGHQW